MKSNQSLAAICLGLSPFILHAGTIETVHAPTKIYSFAESWSVTASLGYGNYSDVYSTDGDVTLGRLAISKDIFSIKGIMVGLEGGVQNGNRMRIDSPQSALDEFNGLPIDSTLKPMPDLLVTVKTPSLGITHVFAQVKGGIVYRQWQFDGVIVKNKSAVASEFQAGLGYRLTNSASITLSYQRMFGANPALSTNPETEIGTVANIPVLNAGLLGFTWII